MAAAGKMDLKLMVNKASNRVECAECDYNLVDVLFSFLTMPMGAIMQLVGKETKMGCMGELCQSVEALDEWYFPNEACKTMLLRPRSSTELKCANLAVNVAGTTEYCLYACGDDSCVKNSNRLVSYYGGCQCHCGGIMDHQLRMTYPSSSSTGVFLQGKKEFVLRDDLQVIPFVSTSSLSFMKKIGLTDGNSVEERDVKIGLQEVLSVLKCALHSQTALTDAFLSNNIPTGQVKLKTEEKTSDSSVKIEQREKDRRRMKGKLVMNRSTKRVLYLEAREDLVNQILSFLTFPLGFVLKLIRGRSPLLGCVGNIYEAAMDFGTDDAAGLLFNSEESKTELLSPRLGCFMGCDDQLLINHLVEAADSPSFYTVSCPRHYRTRCSSDVMDTKPGRCKHGDWKSELKPINPKRPNAVTDSGGGFVKINTQYMITDDLSVKPLSSSTVLRLMNKYKVTTDELEEQDISIGEEEAVSILRAAMTSKTVFTDVFFPTAEKGKRFRSGSLGAY